MVREDLRNEMGLTINTMEELDSAFEKAHETYPDMTTIVFNYIHQFGWLRKMMGVPGSSYYDNNGTLEWYIRHEKQLDYYKKVNEWYRKGYIASENFAFQTEDETKELVVTGKAISNFGYDNHADNFNTAIAAHGDSFKLKLISDVISPDAKVFNNHAGGRGLYITKSCKELEAAYKTVAYAYSQEGQWLLHYGIEGEDYTMDNDGYPIFNFDYQGDNTVLEPRGLKYWGW